MDNPLVTVICLCYNHSRFVKEALESVFAQSYRHIEVIVIDDASDDGSQAVIQDVLKEHPEVLFHPLEKNVGNCAAFNKGLRLAKGSYIVDFATDDVMIHDRIEKQVAYFENLDATWGIVFTDALYIDSDGNTLHQHFHHLLSTRLINSVPTGDVFEHVLRRYFINGPSMLVRKEVFDQLGGYDESLAYEDFDFWVRSSREFKYAYLDEVLTKVRKHSSSMSSRLHFEGDLQMQSTYQVCIKARDLIRRESEKLALVERLRIEHRRCVLLGKYGEASQFFGLLRDLHASASVDFFWRSIALLKIPLKPIMEAYYRLRF